MVNPTQIIEQNHALSNPSTTKQIAPALLELEASLQAHEDHLAHQFMGRVEAIERTQELDRVGVMPLGHALRMMTHYDVQDLPTANETYQRWSNMGTFIEGKMYANFDLDTITVTVYVAEVMSPHQSTWEDLTYAQMGTYPDLNEDCVILAEDEALADFETSAPRHLDKLGAPQALRHACGGRRRTALPSGHHDGDKLFDADWSSQFPHTRDHWFIPQASYEAQLIQKLEQLDTSTPRQALRHALGGTRRTASPSARLRWPKAHRTTLNHLVKCGGCHLLFPPAQIRSKLCVECRILTPDILQPCTLRPQASTPSLPTELCIDCSEPTEFGVMCAECEEALLSAFEPRSKTKQGLYA